MRLSTTKLSGFKSFVEPLAANFGRRGRVGRRVAMFSCPALNSSAKPLIGFAKSSRKQTPALEHTGAYGASART